MRKLGLILSLSFILFCTDAASMIWADQATLLKIEGIDIKLSDNITDNCLLDIKDIEERVISKVTRAGITYDKHEPWRLYLSFIGFAPSDGVKRLGCVVSHIFELFYMSPSGLLVVADSRGVAVGPQHQDDVLLSKAEDFVDEFIIAILKARINSADARRTTPQE